MNNREIKITTIILLAIIILISTFLFIRDYAYQNEWNSPIDSLIFSHWGSFISGIMASGAFIFTFLTFYQEQKNNKSSRKIRDFEERFFKMIENLQFIVGQINIQVPIATATDDGKIKDINNQYNTLIVADNEHKILNRIYDNRPIDLTGRQAIHILLTKLLEALPVTTIDDIWDEGQTKTDRENLRYDEFYDKYFYLLGHYFRFIYHIIKYVDEQNEIEDLIEKNEYIDLLQAQISTDEMGLIFYNAVFNEKAKIKATGEAKFHKLLEKYKFLENIDNKSILKEEHKKKYYPETFDK